MISKQSHEYHAELAFLATLVYRDASSEVAYSTSKTWSTQDWLEKLAYHGISLLTLQNAAYQAKSAQPTVLSTPVLEQLTATRALAVANESLKTIELHKTLTAIHNQVPSVVFKGTALAYSDYDQPWLRPRTDTDLLIEYSDLHTLRQVLQELGYTELFAIQGEFVSYQTTFGKTLIGNSHLNIDVHWRINNRQILANALGFREIIDSSQPAPSLSEFARIPSPVHSLLLACIHRAGHHNKEERLAWLYDIHLLTQRFCDDQWSEFIRISVERKIHTICADALLRASLFFSCDVSHRLDAAEHVNPNNEPSTIFLCPNLPEWRYFLSDLKSLPTMRKKLKFIQETVFPDPSYIRKKMNTSLASYGYLKRLFRGLRRFTHRP